MKRILAILISLIILTGVCGCTDKNANSSLQKPSKPTVSNSDTTSDISDNNDTSDNESQQDKTETEEICIKIIDDYHYLVNEYNVVLVKLIDIMLGD